MLRILLPALLCAPLCGCMSFTTAQSLGLVKLVEPTHCAAEEVAALPAGAQVELAYDAPDGRFRSCTTGIVLKATPDGVALYNCVVQERNEVGFDAANRILYVSRLFRNTGVGAWETPVLWVPLDQIGGVQILTPPPEGYVAPNLPLGMRSGEVYEQLDAQGVPISPIKGRAVLD